MTRYIIAAYEIDRAYGGPEEGGWWYDTGKLMRLLAIKHNEEKAYSLARRLNGWLNKIQNHLPEVSSVIYGGGRYAVEVWEDRAPEYYPAERPHYE